MSFTFAAPNAVHYNAASVKQVLMVTMVMEPKLLVYNDHLYGNVLYWIFESKSRLQIDVPSFSGSFGILPAHVASLAVLKPGVVTVYEEDGATKKFFVSSGSITINDDSSVQILAEEAHAVEDLDAAGAKAALADVSADVHRFHEGQILR